MDIKGVMSELGMNAFGLAALVLFFACFVGIVVWTWTRPRREIDAQARLPLEQDD